MPCRFYISCFVYPTVIACPATFPLSCWQLSLLALHMLASGLHPRQLTSCLQVCYLLTFGPLISGIPVYITLASNRRSHQISFWPSILSCPKPTSQTGHAKSVPQVASHLPTKSLAFLVPDSPVNSPSNSQKSLFQKPG